MRFRDWVDTQVKLHGKGQLARLCRETGLSYPTVHDLYHEKHVARYDTAAKLSAATSGAVTIAELCEPPRARKRRRAA